MPCTIRPLRATDEADWRRLWTGYLEFYKTSVPEAVYVSTFARLLGDDARDFNCLVAEVDGKMVGLTHYLSHRHAWKIEEVIYLQDLYVDPAVRGTGAGTALLSAAMAFCQAQGYQRTYLWTFDGLPAARHLYEKFGFKFSRPASEGMYLVK